jgi:hypothetical protein
MINTHVGTIQPESVKTYAVYDEQTGEIHHVHEFITFKGGEKVDDHEAESRALSATKVRFPYLDTLKVLHVPEGVRQPGIIYAVDPKTLRLIPKERPRAT